MPVQSQQDQDYLAKVQGDLENAKKRSSISTPTQAASATPQGSSIVSKNMESSIEPKRNFPNPNRRASIINHNVPAEAGMDPDAESMKGFQMVLEMICAASLDAVVIIDSMFAQLDSRAFLFIFTNTC